VPPLKPTEYIAYPANYAPPAPPKPVAAPQPVEAAAPAVAASGSDGLVQIETDPGKFSAITEAAPAGNQPVNRRRTRQREVYVENEPLVQIETQPPQA
jgi:hypothetical protein